MAINTPRLRSLAPDGFSRCETGDVGRRQLGQRPRERVADGRRDAPPDHLRGAREEPQVPLLILTSSSSSSGTHPAGRFDPWPPPARRGRWKCHQDACAPGERPAPSVWKQNFLDRNSICAGAFIHSVSTRPSTCARARSALPTMAAPTPPMQFGSTAAEQVASPRQPPKVLLVQVVRHVPQVARTLAVGEPRPVDPGLHPTGAAFVNLHAIELAPGGDNVASMA